jgi:hypothetical protein
MLFILRQLRRSFFQPGKLRTYVAYAIGEILLIVIGILIAVQIGDWKDDRKLNLQRAELIENLKAEFQINREMLATRIEHGNAYAKRQYAFLSLLNSGISHLSKEELNQHLAGSFQANNFTPFLASYQSAKSNGSLDLIRNRSLDRLFVTFEQSMTIIDRLNSFSAEEFFQGSTLELRRMVGSLGLLTGGFEKIPEAKLFSMNKDDIEAFVTRKDVYATFENKLNMHRNLLDLYKDLDSITEQILNHLKEI